MNRPIKFRVWDKRENKGMSTQNMLYDAQLHHLWQDFVDYPGSYELMQYTGCHDSSNNEIYEGDIIQYNNGDVIRIGYVGFMAGIFFLNYPDETDDELGYLLVSNLKVIGNKFEHSELLK
jgi:uncharacterized phage protein (TIGR01671 family)